MKCLTLIFLCAYLQLILAQSRELKIPSAMKEFAGSMPNTKEFLQALVRKDPFDSILTPGSPGRPSYEANLFSGNSDRPNPAGAAILQSMVSTPAGGCAPKEVSVTLPSDPDPSVLYYPTCVLAQRCGGCCTQDQHECASIRTETISAKVVKARYPYLGAPDFVYMGLKDVELDNHLTCACQCKNKPYHCDATKHVYETATCFCRCLNDANRNSCKFPKSWDNHQCACVCPVLKYCQAHEYFSFSTCGCETSGNIVSTAIQQGSLTDTSCTATRCRSGFMAVKILGVCQCQMSTSWGYHDQASFMGTGMPPTTTPHPEASTQRVRPGRRPSRRAGRQISRA